MSLLKIYYRLLTRNKLFSFISIGGFSLSLGVVILLLSFIRSEKQYDQSIPELVDFWNRCSGFSGCSHSYRELANLEGRAKKSGEGTEV